MKKDVLLNTFDYYSFKRLLKKNKNPMVVPFYVILSEKQYNELYDFEKTFLKNYYTKENEVTFTSDVIFISHRNNNPISNWNSFLIVDEYTFKVIRKFKITNSTTIKDDKGFIMEKYTITENGNSFSLDLKELLAYLPIDKFIEIDDKVKD